jgi:hypothetical protein
MLLACWRRCGPRWRTSGRASESSVSVARPRAVGSCSAAPRRSCASLRWVVRVVVVWGCDVVGRRGHLKRHPSSYEAPLNDRVLRRRCLCPSVLVVDSRCSCVVSGESWKQVQLSSDSGAACDVLGLNYVTGATLRLCA